MKGRDQLELEVIRQHEEDKCTQRTNKIAKAYNAKLAKDSEMNDTRKEFSAVNYT